MSKYNPINIIQKEGIIAVVRADSCDDAIQLSKACFAGGIRVIEITFTVPKANHAIQALIKDYFSEGMVVGAGTVLDIDTARLAINAGAMFIVGPNFSQEVAGICKAYDVPYFPGCMTITEMINAVHAGAEIIKLFPGSVFGPSYVKAVHGPLPNMKIMPTGGVNLDNVIEWFKNGVCAVGVGGELTRPYKDGNYEAVTENAKAFYTKIQSYLKGVK